MAKITMTPEEFADKQARNLKNAGEDIRRGIEAVQVSPGKRAASQIEKMRTNFNKAIDSGKTKAALESIDLADWKSKTIDKGIPRISAGIDNARSKVVAFAGKLFPHIESGLSQLDSMPSTTLQDNINRMVTWVNHMAKFKYR
jgi:hypothetical protein